MKKTKKLENTFLNFPAIILNDDNLSALDRFLLALIISLDKEKGCFASNFYLSKYLNCSVGTVSKSIQKMKELTYIIFNQEDEDHGGRRYIRKVRADLKFRQPEKPISTSGLSKKTHLPIENDSLIYKEIKKKELNNNELLIMNEKKLIQNLLTVKFSKKAEFYYNCKEEYDRSNRIQWDQTQIKALILLCNQLCETFGTKFPNDDDKTKLPGYLLKIFNCIIHNPPKFFTDFLPATFLKFWNKVIQQDNFLRSFNRINIRSSERRESSHF